MKKGELIQKIAEIDPGINTDGMGVKELERTLQLLTSDVQPAADEDVQPAADEDVQPAADDVADDRFFIAPGRAITSMRGVLGPGDETFDKDFPAGGATIADLIGRGYIVRG